MTELTLVSSSVKESERAAKRPSFLHGWPWLRFVEDEYAVLDVKGWALPEGPAIAFNGTFYDLEALENRIFAKWWLPSALYQILHLMLDESCQTEDGVGQFNSPAWEAFRQTICAAEMDSWDEIVRRARKNGSAEIAEDIMASLYVESGLESRLMRSGLRTVVSNETQPA